MGIYYGAFNATKREWFTGHEMDQGAKWGETLYGNPAVALVVLLDDDGRACADPWRGRWGGDRIHVCYDAGVTWEEVIARLEGCGTREPPPWQNIGRDLHEYLLRKHELPCKEPSVHDGPGDYEPICKNCGWPMSIHGKHVGMATRR